MISHRDQTELVLVVHPEPTPHRRTREALELGGFEVVSATSSASAEALIAERDPDLLLLPLDLGNGTVGARLARSTSLPVVAIVTERDVDQLRHGRSAHLDGCVVAPFANEQLWAIVETAIAFARRERSLRADAEHRVRLLEGTVAELRGAQHGPCLRLSRTKPPHLPGRFSPREREVLELLVAHKRPKTIAATLGISASTVRNHLKSMYEKVGVSSQEALLASLLEGPV